MNDSLIKRFLEKLERTFQKERKYEFRHGVKTRDGLKNVQEITVAKIMIQNLAEYCLGKQKSLESNLFRMFFTKRPNAKYTTMSNYYSWANGKLRKV